MSRWLDFLSCEAVPLSTSVTMLISDIRLFRHSIDSLNFASFNLMSTKARDQPDGLPWNLSDVQFSGWSLAMPPFCVHMMILGRGCWTGWWPGLGWGRWWAGDSGSTDRPRSIYGAASLYAAAQWGWICHDSPPPTEGGSSQERRRHETEEKVIAISTDFRKHSLHPHWTVAITHLVP